MRFKRADYCTPATRNRRFFKRFTCSRARDPRVSGLQVVFQVELHEVNGFAHAAGPGARYQAIVVGLLDFLELDAQGQARGVQVGVGVLRYGGDGRSRAPQQDHGALVFRNELADLLGLDR